MTTTYTTSSTFTRTHARYLASKIASDLRQLQLFYHQPSDKQIENYLQEAVVLLHGGYLESVSYGFKRGDEWVVALKYNVQTSGILSDDRSGRVAPGANVTGADWYSFLTYTPSFSRLTLEQRRRVEALLPFTRSYGEEPKATGVWTADKSYSSGGVGLQRRMFTQF